MNNDREAHLSPILLLEASFSMLCLFLGLPLSLRKAKKSLEFPPDHPGLLSDISSARPCD